MIPINTSAVSGQPRLVFLIYNKLKFLILQFIAFSVLETESYQNCRKRVRIEEASSKFFEYSLRKNSHKHFKLFGILLLYLGKNVFQRTITD